MDVMLQRHCARYIYVVPDGLRELLCDISREVLRVEPADIYTFIADYLDALLITRENARISAKFVQYMCEAAETIVDLLNRTGMTREEADRAATIIQEAFRAWNERKGILKEDEETMVAKIIEEAGIGEGLVQAAAVVIQNAFRAFKMRQQKEAQLLSGIIDWRVAARSAIRLYRRTGVSPEEAKRAANLIKAAYKGYYTRRAIRQLNEQGLMEEIAPEEEQLEGSGSTLSVEEKKGKGVRIDYTTVLPHVDFGDEEHISRDLTSIIEEEAEPQRTDEDVMARIFGEGEKPAPRIAETFVKDILREIVSTVVGDEEKIELPTIEDKESDTDIFVPPPVEEPEEPVYNKSLTLPMQSQDELEAELQEAKHEMLKLKRASKERSSSVQGAPPEEPPSDHEEAPAEQQEAPVESEEAPAESEEPPAEPQEAPAEPQEAPAEPQEAPAEPQEAPAEQQEAPAEPQEPSAEPQEAPAEPQEAPAEAQEAPAEPQEAPPEQQEASAELQETPDQPQEEQEAPAEPQEAEAPPAEETSEVPGEPAPEAPPEETKEPEETNVIVEEPVEVEAPAEPPVEEVAQDEPPPQETE